MRRDCIFILAVTAASAAGGADALAATDAVGTKVLQILVRENAREVARYPCRLEHHAVPSDTGSDHRPPSFDPAEVCRQLQTSGGDTGVATVSDRISGLNRAYLTSESPDEGLRYVNSGLRILTVADDQVTEIELVRGVVSAQVEWKARRPGISDKRANEGLSETYVKARFPSAGNVPFDMQSLRRDFARAAEDPAFETVTADIKPGDQPGLAALKLTVVPRPRYDLYMSLANSRSPSIGGERLAVGGMVRNLLGSGSVTAVEAGETSGAADIRVTLAGPVLTGWNYTVSAGYNDAGIVDQALRVLDIRSRDSDVQAGLTYRWLNAPPDPEAGRAGHYAAAGINVIGRRSETFLLGEPFSFSPGAVRGRSEYSAIRTSADWTRRNEVSVLTASGTATFGLSGTRSDIPGLASPDPHFRTFLGQISYARRVSRPNRMFEVRARLAGQFASGLLYSGERFALGGDSTVRGYRQNLILADEGLMVSAAVRCFINLNGNWCTRPGIDARTFTLEAFIDAGTARNRQGPEPQPQNLGSAGVSLYWAPQGRWSARLTLAKAFNEDARQGKDLQDRGVSFEVVFRPFAGTGRRAADAGKP